jgi:hypothetical protein
MGKKVNAVGEPVKSNKERLPTLLCPPAWVLEARTIRKNMVRKAQRRDSFFIKTSRNKQATLLTL